MAWFGEGLSSLKGQIQSFTKEVLSEGNQEFEEGGSEVTALQRKIEELEGQCALQSEQIESLRRRNSELGRSKSVSTAAAPRLTVDENGHVEIPLDSDWTDNGWEVPEQHSSSGICEGAQGTCSLPHLSKRIEEELKEKDNRIEFLEKQLQKSEEAKHKLNETCLEMRSRVQQLTKEIEVSVEMKNKIENLHHKLQSTEDELNQMKERAEKSCTLEGQLKVAESKVEELERDLQITQQQQLSQLNDLQVDAGELREEVQQARKQLGPPSGDLLRARQDMVNRIIQIGEKSREVASNVRRLEQDDRGLTKQIESIVNNMLDPEHQEKFHGDLQSLIYENHALKLRNAELEMAVNNNAAKGSIVDTVEASSHKPVGNEAEAVEDPECSTEYSFEEKWQTKKQQLDNQVHNLQTQVDVYERDIEHFEMIKSDWLGEKQSLQNHLTELKQQLKEKEENLNLLTAQKGLLDVRRESEDLTVGHIQTLAATEKERDELHARNECLCAETEAMKAVIQDLESQLSKMSEDNSQLSRNVELLDEEHQKAIDQVLQVKNSLQKENDRLKSEVCSLKMELTTAKPEIVEKKNIATLTEEWSTADNSETYLQDILSRVVTFEIPQEYFSKKGDAQTGLVMLEAVVRMCTDNKWKRETLERKVAELGKEVRQRAEVIQTLEGECAALKGNVDSLLEELMSVGRGGGGEALAPIPENSEEMEAMEQRTAALENEVAVLHEARANLEADAQHLRDRVQVLQRHLQAAEETGRNQENMLTEQLQEITYLQKEVAALKAASREDADKMESMEAEISLLRERKEGYINEIAMLHETAIKDSFIQADRESETISLRDERDRLLEEVSSLRKTSPQENTRQTELIPLKGEVSLLQEVALKDDNFTAEREAELCSLKEERDCLIEKMTRLEVTVDGNSKQLNEVLHQKHELEASLQCVVDGQNNSEEQLKCEINSLKHLVETLQEQLHGMGYANNLLKERISHMEKLEADLQSREEVIKEMKLKEDQVCVAASQLEEKCHQLELELFSREEEVEAIKLALRGKELELNEVLLAKMEMDKVSSVLEDEKVCNHEQLEQEIKKWKNNAETTERQLDEALQARTNLEQECKRLFSVQTKVQNQEHLEREVTRLTDACVSAEEKLNEALEERAHLQQGCVTLQAQLLERAHLEEEVERWKMAASSTEQHLKDVEEARAGLQASLAKLRSVETKLESCKSEVCKWKSMHDALHDELTDTSTTLVDTRLECKRLQSVEAKLKNHSVLEQEVSHWKSTAEALQKKLDDVFTLKSAKDVEIERLEVDFKNTHHDSASAYSDFYVEKADLGKEELKECESSHQRLQSGELHKEVMVKCEEDIEKLQSEKQSILSILEEKTRENGLLKMENSRLLEIISHEKSAATNLMHENSELLSYRRYQDSETSEMAKETIANLAKIIREKDLEIETLKQKCESITALLQEPSNKAVEQLLDEKNTASAEVRQLREDLNRQGSDTQHCSTQAQQPVGEVEHVTAELLQLRAERDELIRTVQVKHHENVQYHGEIQRLSALLNQELHKSEESRRQFEDKQKMLFNTQNELIAVKQRLQKLESRATFETPHSTDSAGSKGRALQQLSKLQLAPGDLDADQFTGHPSSLQDKEVDELKRSLEAQVSQLTDSLQREQTRNKYLQNEVQEQHEKESALLKELARLRLHLVGVEESYTAEALRMEEQVSQLQSKLTQAEERLKTSSTAYTSASIRANQQVESLQTQARLVAQQRDETQQKLSASEDQVQKHAAALRNLQAVLEQFQRDKEREVADACAHLQQQLHAEHSRQEQLLCEITSLKAQLIEAQEGLSAAARLGAQLDRKAETITSLKEEVAKLQGQLDESKKQMQSTSHNVETKVDRNLIKNLVLGYLGTPPNNRNQVLRVIATVLDFSQEDRMRAGMEGTSGGWFRGLAQPGGPHTTQSLSEAFVRFLESESRPQPQLRLLPEAQQASRAGSRSNSPSSSTGSQSRSPLLLSEVQLPSFTRFPVSQNSSSILKDVLKDS